MRSVRGVLIIVTLTMLFGVGAGTSAGADLDGFDKPPVWQVGETWHYIGRLPNRPELVFYDLTWRVVEPNTLASLENQGGHDQHQYYTSSLAWVGFDSRSNDLWGRTTYEPTARFDPPIPFYAWPLVPGKTWEQCSMNTVPPGGKHCNSFTVLRIEEARTPAGTFRAAVLEQKIDGRLLSIRWYAPAVKNIVRNEQYVPNQGERLKLILELDATNVGVTAAAR